MIVAEEDRLDEALALADLAEAQADDMRTQVGLADGASSG